MTRALYHDLPDTLTFAARVTEVQGQEVVLDATAFYPEGGGQASDVGVLRWDGGEANVVHTRKDRARGVVWHALEGNPPPIGAEVHGEVDAQTRWRHAQRHSGEHLLAQSFVRVNPAFQVAAVSMTGPECTLDLRGDPAPVHLRAAEALLRATLGRRPLRRRTPVVDDADLAAYPLRREAAVRGRVRLVIFEDDSGEPYDVSACGGTHVPWAALCAPVVILRAERIKSGLTRVVFMAGEEATELLGRTYQDARTVGQALSVPVERVPERVADLQARITALEAEADGLRRDLAGHLIMVTAPEMVGGVPVRLLDVPSADLLLPALSAVPAGEVVGAVAPDGRCGVASSVPDVAAGTVLRAVLALTGGRGGGKPDQAQGMTDQPGEFLAALRGVLAG